MEVLIINKKHMEKEPKMNNFSPEEKEILESDKKARELHGELLKVYGSIEAEEFIEKVFEYAEELDKAARLRESLRNKEK